MNKGTRTLISIVVLATGIGAYKYLVSTKPSPQKTVKGNIGAAVEIMTVQETSSNVVVRARGTVMPAREVLLGTEVGGKVIDVAANLQPGGKFQKGDVIVRIDPSDYRIAVQQTHALVDSAQAQLAVEESRRAVAKREWDMFGDKDKDTANKQLALREPQLRSASTQLKSAQSSLKRARLGVERTLLRAPFDGMIKARNVDLGQIVAPGSPILNFVGTHSYWVQVSIPVERLAWISMPGVNGQREGSKVTIHHRVGHEHIKKQGKILRLLSDVDPAGRMARVLIEIQDPLGQVAADAKRDRSQTTAKTEVPFDTTSALPLLLGTYVEVEIEGRSAEHVVELSRAALHEGDTVYLMSENSTLEKRKVEILWRRENVVLLSSGLKAGDAVVISPLADPVSGMKLRIPGTETPPTPQRPPQTQRAQADGTEKEGNPL